MQSKPSPERVFQVLVRILERRYDVKIAYILEKTQHKQKEGENYECYNY